MQVHLGCRRQLLTVAVEAAAVPDLARPIDDEGLRREARVKAARQRAPHFPEEWHPGGSLRGWGRVARGVPLGIDGDERDVSLPKLGRQ